MLLNMLRVTYKCFLVLLIGFTAKNVAAETIYDSGATVSTKPYFQRAGIVEIDFARVPKQVYSESIKSSRQYLDLMFPVRSNMKSGKVVNRPATVAGLSRPICIIGSDRRSYLWVKKNVSKLIKAQVLCFMVNTTKNDFQRFKKAFDNLEIMPSAVDDLAKSLSIEHYPVLISKGYIEQ